MRVLGIDTPFTNMLRSVGNGSYGRDDAARGGFAEEYICLPDDLVIDSDTTYALTDLVHFVYPDLQSIPINALPSYLSQRAILAPKNDVVASVNAMVLAQVPVAEELHQRVYTSADSIKPLEDGVLAAAEEHPSHRSTEGINVAIQPAG